jgi:hypothetical protein
MRTHRSAKLTGKPRRLTSEAGSRAVEIGRCGVGWGDRGAEPGPPEFAREVKARVNDYFEQNRLSRRQCGDDGANGYIWKITHNAIHHTYTNIRGYDEDLEVSPLIRLSPHGRGVLGVRQGLQVLPAARSRTLSQQESIRRSSGCFWSSARPHTISR